MPEKFCTITPDRGDRPQLLEFCKHQLSRMTVKPDASYFIDHSPEDSRKDIIPRIKKGIEMAKADGIDNVYIVENDDFYPKNYFEHLPLNGFDFTGASTTLCYSLRFHSYESFTHTHSSLFHTGFKISSLGKFRWPDDDVAMLDLKLWKFANASKLKRNLLTEPIAISIKHNIGLAGGKGHRMDYKNKDYTREVLRGLVDAEAYAFYQSLKV